MIILLGSPFMDIIATVDHTFLDKYNLKPDNAIRATESQAEIFSEILGYHPIFQPGGSVTNTARVSQWVSRKLYPMTFIGPIGDDSYGGIIRKKFSEEEIHCHLIEVKNQRTGVCAVLLTEGNRSLVTYLGVTVGNFLDEHIWEDVTKGKFLYLSAFRIRASFGVMKELVEHFLETKKYVIFNLAASAMSEKYSKEVLYLFKNSDMVFGNESEFTSFAKICNTQNANNKNLLLNINKRFANKPSRALIMTRGAKSIFVLYNGTVEEFATTQLDEKKIVDTNGAGDAFVGGFLAQFINEKSIWECVRCGTWAATEVIQNIGCNFDNKLLYN